MHCGLVSSTGVLVQAGRTWGDTSSAGFDGGTIPAAPAPDAPATTSVEPTPIVIAMATRADHGAMARRAEGMPHPRSPPSCRVGNGTSRGNVPFPRFGAEGEQAELSAAWVGSMTLPTPAVAMVRHGRDGSLAHHSACRATASVRRALFVR